jgi:hypothetical protein
MGSDVPVIVFGITVVQDWQMAQTVALGLLDLS